MKNNVRSATLLADGKKLEVTSNASGIIITVPSDTPNKISSTVVLKIKGAPEIVETWN